MSDAFLWVIGGYNVLGAFAMLVCTSEAGGDKLLRQWMEILAEPYTHGRYGPIWVWFSSFYTFFLGALMLLATRWENLAKKDLTLMVLVVYLLGLLLALAGARSPHYKRRGLYATYLLWPAQIAWGVWYYQGLR